jgi:release factor glutamine methyltransferase
MSVAAALAAAAARLRDAGVPGAAADARALMAHALGLPADRLTLHAAEPLPPECERVFVNAVEARLRRQPVAQITGQRCFWGRSFRVTPDVLDPRPETEVLVAQALAAPFASVLDLGTGSGAILLTLLAERPAAAGLGSDVSPAALAVARDNAARLGLAARFVLSDWFAAVRGTFDLIVSNPPYIAAAEMAGLAPEVRDWEPHLALSPGGDGLGAFRAICAGAAAHLAPGGRLLLEIGPGQAAAVAALARAGGLARVAVHRDLDGRERVVEAGAG